MFAGAADVLHAEAADNLSLRLAGPFAPGLQAEPDNLVLRAARALAAHAGVPARARLTLDKHLPVASGIGGGSADAAAALRLLARLWQVQPAEGDLLPIASTLGADVPVCLESRSARMGGIGEVLTPAPAMPEYGILLVNPGIAVSTPEVFRCRTGAFSAAASLPPGWPDAHAMAADLAALGNDLEAPATQLRPEILDVLAWLRTRPGCLLARMSGSGATCFALFSTAAAARHEAGAAPADWWAWGGPHA